MNHARSRIGLRPLPYGWAAERAHTWLRRNQILYGWRVRLTATQRRVRAILAAPSPVALGRILATSRGWQNGSQWSALYVLWNRESGWDPYARNSSSGACGIPQFVPCRDYGDAHSQIIDGLAYIAGRYGSPAAALAHSDAYGWY